MDDVCEPVTEPVRPLTAANCEKLHPLLHRWFVEYNPAYFASALCLLAGIFLISDGLGGAKNRSGELWLIGVVQLYELMLIGGAAFLYRVLHQRRPAVVLALVEMVYLLDPTMQTEVAAYMETAGLLVSAAWLLAFVVKMRALSWALRIDLSRSLAIAGVLVAAAIAGFPHLLYGELIEGPPAVCGLAVLVFGVGVALLRRPPKITSRVALDEWGQTVLRRAAVAVAAVWGALFLGHVAIWVVASEMEPGALVRTVPLLLAVLLLRRELEVWAAVALAVALSFTDPFSVWVTAAMASIALLLRGRRGFVVQSEAASAFEEISHPYRTTGAPSPELAAQPMVQHTARLFVGAVLCAYLAVWSFGWEGGAWPQHLLWLDAAVSGALLLLLRAERLCAALALLGLDGHLAAEMGLFPSSGSQWGALLVGAGFSLLLAGFAISWKLRDAEDP